MHIVFIKNCTPKEVTIKTRLKLWNILPRTLCQTVGAYCCSLVPNEVQKRSFSIEVLLGKQSVYALEVKGYCELTISMKTDDNGGESFSVDLRTPDDSIECESNNSNKAADEAKLTAMMEMHNYYDVLQVVNFYIIYQAVVLHQVMQ